MQFSLAAKAQHIEGKILTETGTPVQGATATLFATKDSSINKISVSSYSGIYQFNNLKEGSYFLLVTAVGFAQDTPSGIVVLYPSTIVRDFTLKKSNNILKKVFVQAKKPMIEVRSDKMILNVEGTINDAGLDALELLRKSPGIAVDKDENLNFEGKNGVSVYIDGHPTHLSGSDLSTYLKSLQSGLVESIELISQPSAQYEAEGNAGIINIRLKKNKSIGTNSTITGGWRIGIYSNLNGGLNFNYRNDKVNIFSSYNLSQSIQQNMLIITREILDTAFHQNGTILVRNISHNYKAGIDYTINKRSSIGFVASGIHTNINYDNYSYTAISSLADNKLNRILIANNKKSLARNNLNVNLNYNYTASNGNYLEANADHSSYINGTKQFQPNYYYDASGQIRIDSQINQISAPTSIYINALKVDRQQNIGNGKLDMGLKYSNVQSVNDYQLFDVFSNTQVLDKDQSNYFTYNETIDAAYFNYASKYKSINIKAGVRVENTISKARSQGLKNTASGYLSYDSSFRRQYTDIFPSASLGFNLNASNQISFGYNRRIDRPSYQTLNPFEYKLDAYTLQKGNTNLRPQYTSSISITHSYQNKLITSLTYSRIGDLFTLLTDTIQKSKVFFSNQNLATESLANLVISYPLQYKFYSLFSRFSAYYSHYHADFGPGRRINLDVRGISINLQNNFTLSNIWSFEINGFFHSPDIYEGTFKTTSLWSLDAGLQQVILKGRLSIKESVSDIFHTLNFKDYSIFAGQSTLILTRYDSRQFKINVSYKFGNNQSKSARLHNSSAEEEQKRVQ
ncbi:MAG: outer membrane beta-barrel family protein [Flavisolibacter sp.]